MFSTNVFGGLNLARAVLPGMRARRQGTILWNGSQTGWEPAPVCGLYSMSKFCLRGGKFVKNSTYTILSIISMIVRFVASLARGNITLGTTQYHSRARKLQNGSSYRWFKFVRETHRRL